LGIGDWVLGIEPNPKYKNPNPQSPIPMFNKKNQLIINQLNNKIYKNKSFKNNY